MTAIVTVHGTFANHTDDAGEKWWQTGSHFQKQITARLDTGQDGLDWVPFHWSGENSELDRRAGGEALFAFLKENFENKNKPYHLAGHSHGGSVIAEALRYSTRQNAQLDNLRSWITVATPFLAFKKQKRLFSRVKRRYQLLLAIITAYSLAVLLAVPLGMCDTSVDAKGCWVRKTGKTYSRLADISKVTPNISDKELSDMFSFGAEIETANVGKSASIMQVGDETIGVESWSGRTELISNKIELSFADREFHLTVIPRPDSGSPLTPEDNFTSAFKKLGDVSGEDLGSFPLKTCAYNNWPFFGITKDKFQFEDSTLYRDGQQPEERPEKAYKAFKEQQVLNGSKVWTFEEFKQSTESSRANNMAADFAVLKHACEKINATMPEERKNLESRYETALNWARGCEGENCDPNMRGFGLTDPYTMTFLAEYETGAAHYLRLKFETMKDMSLITFIPLKETLLSLGLLLYLAITSIPVLIAAWFLWRSQKFLRRRYKEANDDLFTEWYRKSWLTLSHPEDEAINAISASTKAKINMAPPDMLQGMFMLGFSSLMAILLIFNGVKWINWIFPGNKFGFKRELIEELGYAINKAQNVANGSGTFSGNNLTGWKAELPLTVFFNDDGGLSIIVLLIVFGLILLGFIYLGRLFEKLILNPLLKTGIDGIAKGSAVGGAFGDDSLGENPAQCLPHPHEFEDPHFGDFPAPVKQAIEKYANEDLIHLPGKFRAVLHKNVSSANDFSLSDLLEGDMGEILLHTSYFDVKEFHDLFTAALISTGDYKAGPHFKNHKKAAKWMADMTARPKAARSG